MLQRLLDDHHGLRAIIAELRPHLHAAAQPIGMCLAASRWALTFRLLRHIAVEGQYLRALGVIALDDVARGVSLAARFNAHLTRWSSTEIDLRWDSYRTELSAFLNEIEEEMLFEERHLFPSLKAA